MIDLSKWKMINIFGGGGGGKVVRGLGKMALT